MRIEVIHSVWGAAGKEFGGGIHEIEKPTKELLRHIAAAEAAGVIRVKASKDERQTLSSHVETQAESEKALAKAQKSGAWQEANQAQFDADVAAGTRTADLGGTG